MHKRVDSKKTTMVTLLARNGEIVNQGAYGSEKGNKVTKDSIYNIMSMTKPIMGVLFMAFVEVGRFQPGDLVS